MGGEKSKERNRPSQKYRNRLMQKPEDNSKGKREKKRGRKAKKQLVKPLPRKKGNG